MQVFFNCRKNYHPVNGFFSNLFLCRSLGYAVSLNVHEEFQINFL